MARFQVEKSGEWRSLGLILGLALFNVFVNDGQWDRMHPPQLC